MNNKDRLRRIVRKVLSKKLYRLGADILNPVSVILKHGFGVYRTLFSPIKECEQYRFVQFRNCKLPVKFRPSTSDVNTLVQNIVREEYGKIRADLNPKLIIDGGGYIGDLAIYFANRFPAAKIITLEPNPESYALACENLAGYGERVEILNHGLWSEAKILSFSDEFTGSKISEDDQAHKISCIGIQDLIEKYNISEIDVLKLDIEGAEEEVLTEKSSEWLNITKLIIVEFHGESIENNTTQYLNSMGFKGFGYRSLHYFYNQNYVA